MAKDLECEILYLAKLSRRSTIYRIKILDAMQLDTLCLCYLFSTVAIPVCMLSWSLHMHARYRSLLSVGDLILLEECSGGFLDILSSESSSSNIP